MLLFRTSFHLTKSSKLLCFIVNNILRGFFNRFKNQAATRGIVIEQVRYDIFDETSTEYINSKFESYKNAKARIVLFFTKDKTDNIHHVFKGMEILYGIVTQHVTGPIMEKGITGGNLVFDNLLLKFNEKLGGVNYILNTSQSFSRINTRFAPDIGYFNYFYY